MKVRMKINQWLGLICFKTLFCGQLVICYGVMWILHFKSTTLKVNGSIV